MANLLDYFPDAKPKGQGEYATACPFCTDADKDGFLIWPHEGRHACGRYWCRQCRQSGDLIDYLQKIQGQTYQQALDVLGIDTPTPTAKLTAKLTAKCSNAVITPPPKIWQQKAAELLAVCQADLFCDNPSTAEPIIKNIYFKRHLTPATCKAVGIGYNPTNFYPLAREWGIDDPNPQKKIRIAKGTVIASKWQGDIVSCYVHFDEPENILGQDKKPILDKDGKPITRKGHCIRNPIPKAGNMPFIAGEQGKPIVLLESALDAALLWQETQGKYTAFAFNGVGSDNLPQPYIDFVKSAPLVIAIPDNDQKKKDKPNKAGIQACASWTKLFPNLRPFYAANEKDIGEMHHKAICLNDANIPKVSELMQFIESQL